MRLYELDAGDTGIFLLDLNSVIAIQKPEETTRDEDSVWLGFHVHSGRYGFPCSWNVPIADLDVTFKKINQIHDDLVTAWKQYLDTAYKQI